jgi:predicted amidohydrolase YtcJ
MNLGPFFWTPTISVLHNNDYIRDHPEMLDDPSWHVGLPDSIVADIQGSLAHFDQLPYYQLIPIRKPTLARKFQQLRESGAVLLIGTDSGVPGLFHSQSTWNELEVWVNRLGVDPMQAIRAATYWPAVFMGVDDQVGTVSEGKRADIIAVRGDVLRHIALLQHVDIVIKDGVQYK